MPRRWCWYTAPEIFTYTDGLDQCVTSVWLICSLVTQGATRSCIKMMAQIIYLTGLLRCRCRDVYVELISIRQEYVTRPAAARRETKSNLQNMVTGDKRQLAQSLKGGLQNCQLEGTTHITNRKLLWTCNEFSHSLFDKIVSYIQLCVCQRDHISEEVCQLIYLSTS